MNRADRERIRAARDRRRRLELGLELDPVHVRYCAASKTFGADRCTRAAKDGSAFCRTHQKLDRKAA